MNQIIFRHQIDVTNPGIVAGICRIFFGLWKSLAKRSLLPFPSKKVAVESKVDFWRGIGVDPNAPGEGILIFTAHDDDPAISIPLLLQAAKAQGIPIRIAIASDGSQGYCTAGQRSEISGIRRAESESAYGADGLGLPTDSCLSWFCFKDTRLAAAEGRFPVDSVSPTAVGRQTVVGPNKMTGLESAMVTELRTFSPKVVIMPTPTDLHTDHQTVAREISISIFHAGGAIWPELGDKLGHVPVVFECATYCNYSSPPTAFLQGTPEMFERGLQAVLCWQSQVQIEALVDRMRNRGPIEFLRKVDWDFYEPLDNLRHFSWRFHARAAWNLFYYGRITE